MSEAVLEVFGQLLDQFDAAVKLGSDGRATHIGATKRLEALAREAGQIVRVMDARNRHRFKNDEQVLGAWVTRARWRRGRWRVGGEGGVTPAPGEGTQAGDVRPAA